MTVKFSQERKVRSLAKKTLGSTRTGRAMRLPAGRGISMGDGRVWSNLVQTRGGLEKRLARHFEGSCGSRLCCCCIFAQASSKFNDFFLPALLGPDSPHRHTKNRWCERVPSCFLRYEDEFLLQLADSQWHENAPLGTCAASHRSFVR